MAGKATPDHGWTGCGKIWQVRRVEKRLGKSGHDTAGMVRKVRPVGICGGLAGMVGRDCVRRDRIWSGQVWQVRSGASGRVTI